MTRQEFIDEFQDDFDSFRTFLDENGYGYIVEDVTDDYGANNFIIEEIEQMIRNGNTPEDIYSYLENDTTLPSEWNGPWFVINYDDCCVNEMDGNDFQYFFDEALDVLENDDFFSQEEEENELMEDEPIEIEEPEAPAFELDFDVTDSIFEYEYREPEHAPEEDDLSSASGLSFDEEEAAEELYDEEEPFEVSEELIF